MSDRKREDEDETTVGVAYPLAQLARAHASGAATAQAKSESWLEVIRGMVSGRLAIGSRTPVAETPAWVTLEVAHGGFATGRFAAGGPLDDFEKSRFDELGRPPGGERKAVNEAFLDASHVADLDAWLGDSCYRIRAPEEAALLTAAWLARRGEHERAVQLLLTVRPWFDRLRFHPRPAAHPLPTTDAVHVATTGEVHEALATAIPQPHVARMNEAIRTYGPLCDRTVTLWLETVRGAMPEMQTDSDGRRVRDARGQPVPVGGFPGAVRPPDFDARARALLADHDFARARHRLTTKSERKGEVYFELRTALARFVQQDGVLADSEARRVRRHLAAFVSAHGAPGTERHRRMRSAQARAAAQPLYADVAHALARRLETFEPDEVLASVDSLIGDLGGSHGEPVDAIPAPVRARLLRCVEGPVETLLADGRIGSAEVLATVVPSLTATARVAPIDDAALRTLVRATYVAFRRRRSLLLLNLESQVRFEELPWVKAVEPWTQADALSNEASRSALARLLRLALVSFPQSILPNRLMKEVRALAAGAGLSLPLVDEIAADIFMGTFRDTFLKAAQWSAGRLGATLYGRYYGIPTSSVLRIDDVSKSRFGVVTSPAFDALCVELAGAGAMARASVASNGAILEWAQILTTHNLVPLIDALGLGAELPLETMAQDAFRWCARSLARPAPRRHVELTRNKNAAYAFRQALCFASLAGDEAAARYVTWARAELAEATEHARGTLEPAVVGMGRALAGSVLGPRDVDAAGRAVRWTGWILRS